LRKRLRRRSSRSRRFREFPREQADALVHAGVTRLEDLLSAEAGDIADIPQIGDSAAAVWKPPAPRPDAGTLSVKS